MQSRLAIALISVHRDPVDETESQNLYVRQLGESLSQLGWQVDMFTRKTNINLSLRIRACLAQFLTVSQNK